MFVPVVDINLPEQRSNVPLENNPGVHRLSLWIYWPATNIIRPRQILNGQSLSPRGRRRPLLPTLDRSSFSPDGHQIDTASRIRACWQSQPPPEN